MHLIQEDLDAFSSEWNTHRIRQSRGSNTPGGVPNELFFIPNSFGKCGPNTHKPYHLIGDFFLHEHVQDMKSRSV